MRPIAERREPGNPQGLPALRVRDTAVPVVLPAPDSRRGEAVPPTRSVREGPAPEMDQGCPTLAPPVRPGVQESGAGSTLLGAVVCARAERTTTGQVAPVAAERTTELEAAALRREEPGRSMAAAHQPREDRSSAGAADLHQPRENRSSAGAATLHRWVRRREPERRSQAHRGSCAR